MPGPNSKPRGGKTKATARKAFDQGAPNLHVSKYMRRIEKRLKARTSALPEGRAADAGYLYHKPGSRNIHAR